MPKAMITGAGSGVGRAVAQALAPSGWSLVLVGRKRDTLEETAKSLTGNPLVAPADVGDPGQVKAVFAQLKDKYGRLDMLFNNAGMGDYGSFASSSADRSQPRSRWNSR